MPETEGIPYEPLRVKLPEGIEHKFDEWNKEDLMSATSTKETERCEHLWAWEKDELDRGRSQSLSAVSQVKSWYYCQKCLKRTSHVTRTI